MLDQWGFPMRIVNAVRYHHAPSIAGGHVTADLSESDGLKNPLGARGFDSRPQVGGEGEAAAGILPGCSVFFV